MLRLSYLFVGCYLLGIYALAAQQFYRLLPPTSAQSQTTPRYCPSAAINKTPQSDSSTYPLPPDLYLTATAIAPALYAPLLPTHLRQYHLYQIKNNPALLPQTLPAIGTSLLHIQLGSDFSGTINLLPSDELWAAGSTIRIVGANGVETVLPPLFNFAYKGFWQTTNKGKSSTPMPYTQAQAVRLCIAADYIGGIIGDSLVIQPLRDFDPAAPADMIVAYSPHQVLTNPNAHCGNLLEQLVIGNNPLGSTLAPHTSPNLTTLRSGECVETVQLALLADYSMTTLAGNADHLTKHLISVTNAIQPAYLSAGLQFQISEIYLSACTACDPVSNVTVASNLLAEIMTWGESDNNALVQPYHVAQFWTNRVFSQGNLVGLANTGGVCTDKRYCEVRQYSPIFDRLRCLSAHELGHTFCAAHDAVGGNIMQATISEFATTFSATSLAAMSACIANRPCLSACSDCKGVAQLKLLNYTGSEAALVWTRSLNSTYTVQFKPMGAAEWIPLSVAYTDTVWYFSDLSPCSGYDFRVQSNCAGGILSTAQTISVIGKRPNAYDIRTYNTDSAKVTWNNTNLPVRLRLRESGTTTWFGDLSIVPPDTVHVFDGLPPCKSYDLSVRTDCADGVYGRDTLLTIRGAMPLNVTGEGVSATVGRIKYQLPISTSPDISFTLRYKRTSSSFWLAEIPNAQPNTYYNITGLQPCTPYEVQAQAYCDATAGSLLSTTFTTASVALLTPNIVNCDAATQTYDLEVRLSHNRLAGTTFTMSAGGVSQIATYSDTSPQTVLLSGIPNVGATTATLTLVDVAFPSLCSDDINYTPPPLACACQTVFWEDFDQCQLPCDWTTQNAEMPNTARWRVGKTHEGNSINGSCMAYFDDDHFDNDGGETVQLNSPILDLSHYSSATLSFDYNFHTIDGTFGVQVFNGSTWVNMWQISAGFCGFWGCSAGSMTLNITPHIQAQFQARWVYSDGNGWDWYAAIDDVEICGYSNLTVCNASFSYPCDTLCSSGDYARPQIAGYGNGIFTATPTGLNLNPSTGEIDPALSMPGTYSITYTTSLGSTTCTSSRSVTITDCKVRVRPRLWLQAPYTLLSGMSTALRAANLLPLQQPYAMAPWNYGGVEHYLTAATIPANAVDWVLLELRDATYPDIVVAQKAAMLFSDGWVSDVAAPTTQGIDFEGIGAGTYYLVVKHRHHLAVMSAQAIPLTAQSNTYDFGSAATQAWGGLLVNISSNRFALYAGDADGNGVINYADQHVYATQNGLTNGYYSADFSLNKSVNALDYGFYRPNIGRFTAWWLRE